MPKCIQIILSAVVCRCICIEAIGCVYVYVCVCAVWVCNFLCWWIFSFTQNQSFRRLITIAEKCRSYRETVSKSYRVNDVLLLLFFFSVVADSYWSRLLAHIKARAHSIFLHMALSFGPHSLVLNNSSSLCFRMLCMTLFPHSFIHSVYVFTQLATFSLFVLVCNHIISSGDNRNSSNSAKKKKSHMKWGNKKKRRHRLNERGTRKGHSEEAEIILVLKLHPTLISLNFIESSEKNILYDRNENCAFMISHVHCTLSTYKHINSNSLNSFYLNY